MNSDNCKEVKVEEEKSRGTAGADGMEKEVFTCREIYEEGARLLAELPDGQLDARLLLEHFCGINTHRLLADPSLPVSAHAREAYLAGIRRRAAREPLAYIRGAQDFMGLSFSVNPDVLIPEQDTENLAEEALRYLEDGSRILDLCTGSGCILLSLLHYSNGCVGTGTDISGAALDIAKKNAQVLGLDSCSFWLQGDLFEALEAGSEQPGDSNEAFGIFPGCGTKKFDLIISNPPYISTGVIGTLAPEVRCAQPLIALDGGPDGLDFYRRIIDKAPDYLVVGGRLMLEIGYDQGQAVREMLEEKGFYAVEIVKDYGGNDRIATGVRSMFLN